MNNTVLTILVIVSLAINVYLIYIVNKLQDNLITLSKTVSRNLTRLGDLQKDILKSRETELRALECIKTNAEAIQSINSELTLIKVKGALENGGE